MKRSQRILFWSVAIFILLLIAGVLLPLAALGTLPFGWLNFLKRTVPEVTVNWSGIGMVILCSGLILVCFHSLLSALTKKRFRFRWSVSIFASLWLLFCLIIAVAGISRTIPLLSNEQWHKRRTSYADLRRASAHASTALYESGGNPHSLRRSLIESAPNWYGDPLWEQFEFLVNSPAQGKSPCIVVIPREANARARFGFSIVSEAGSEDSIPIAKLHERLARLRSSESR
jgi:hypothetical protein